MKTLTILFAVLALAEDQAPIKELPLEKKLELSQALSAAHVAKDEWEQFGKPLYERMLERQKEYSALHAKALMQVGAPADQNCSFDVKQELKCRPKKQEQTK